MIFFMGKINVLGILGNVLVLPIVPFVMIYGFVSVWLFVILQRERLLRIEKILVQYIYTISEILGGYGIYLNVSGLRCKYLILLGFVVFFVRWRKKQARSPHEAKTPLCEKESETKDQRISGIWCTSKKIENRK